MKRTEFAMFVLKGLLSEMDEAQRGNFDGACNEIRRLIERRGEPAKLAIGYVALELGLEDDKK